MDKRFDEETKHDDWSDISDTTEDSESSSNSHGGEFFDVTFTKLLDLIPQSISNCKNYSEIIDRKICQVISKDITVNEFEDFMKKLAAPLLKVSEPITRKEIKIKRTDILGSFPGICQNKGILFTLTEILDQHEYKDIRKCFEILIKDMHLNYLIMNLKAFLNGYDILVFDYENSVERSFGVHSYSDGVMTHIDNGVIPYEILDKLLESRIPLIYDGYLFVRIKSFVNNVEKDFGFYPLRHSNETIDGICDMVAHLTSYDREKMEKIKAQLYVDIFPNLYLSPEPIQNENHTLNLCSENLKRKLDAAIGKRMNLLNILSKVLVNGRISSLNEEAVLEFVHQEKDTEKIRCLMVHQLCTDKEEVKKEIIDAEDRKRSIDLVKIQKGKMRGEQVRERRNEIQIGNLVDRQSTSSEGMEEAEIMIEGKALAELINFIRKRGIVIPDTISCNKLVEVESFIFEFSYKLQEKIELVCDIICVAVPDSTERNYHCACELDKKLCKFSPLNKWFSVGNRTQLDKNIENFAIERQNKNAGYMRVSHKQNFIQLDLVGTKYVKEKPNSQIIYLIDQYPEHHEFIFPHLRIISNHNYSEKSDAIPQHLSSTYTNKPGTSAEIKEQFWERFEPNSEKKTSGDKELVGECIVASSENETSRHKDLFEERFDARLKNETSEDEDPIEEDFDARSVNN